MDIVGILGIAGFVLSLGLAWYQWYVCHRELVLLITYLDCQPTGNETSLVLLRLSFVNPSSQGQTVYSIDVKSMMLGAPLIEVNQEIDRHLQNVTYSLPNVSRQLPFAEILQFPLDIHPNQSLSRWLVIGVNYADIGHNFGTLIHIEATQPAGKGNWKTDLLKGECYFLGVKKHVLAKRNVPLFPAVKTSRTIDIYNEPQTKL